MACRPRISGLSSCVSVGTRVAIAWARRGRRVVRPPPPGPTSRHLNGGVDVPPASTAAVPFPSRASSRPRAGIPLCRDAIAHFTNESFGEPTRAEPVRIFAISAKRGVGTPIAIRKVATCDRMECPPPSASFTPTLRQAVRRALPPVPDRHFYFRRFSDFDRAPPHAAATPRPNRRALRSLGQELPRRQAKARLPTRFASEPELPRDDHLHDLVGAGVDALNAGVHVRAADRILEHVAVATEELEAGVDHPLGHLRLPELGH